MRAVRIREAGGPEVLEVVSLPVPEPREGEVLLRVHRSYLRPLLPLLDAGRAHALADEGAGRRGRFRWRLCAGSFGLHEVPRQHSPRPDLRAAVQ